jgi:hypothetical protein
LSYTKPVLHLSQNQTKTPSLVELGWQLKKQKIKLFEVTVFRVHQIIPWLFYKWRHSSPQDWFILYSKVVCWCLKLQDPYTFILILIILLSCFSHSINLWPTNISVSKMKIMNTTRWSFKESYTKRKFQETYINTFSLELVPLRGSKTHSWVNGILVLSFGHVKTNKCVKCWWWCLFLLKLGKF